MTEMTKKNIMVVDDSATMRMFLSMTVRKAMPWISVTEAVNGADALSKLRGGAFDLVLTDMQMPEMNGAELISAIRGELSKTLPVIIITTKGEEGDRDFGLATGANGYITKPVSGQALKETLMKSFTESGE